MGGEGHVYLNAAGSVGAGDMEGEWDGIIAVSETLSGSQMAGEC